MYQMIETLKKRFEKNMKRHENVKWDDVYKKLDNKVVEIIERMETFGGEPDVITFKDELYIVDFSKETPKPRTSICYDEEARLSRKKISTRNICRSFSKKNRYYTHG